MYHAGVMRLPRRGRESLFKSYRSRRRVRRSRWTKVQASRSARPPNLPLSWLERNDNGHAYSVMLALVVIILACLVILAITYIR
jgi:hypothetical protein